MNTFMKSRWLLLSVCAVLMMPLFAVEAFANPINLRPVFAGLDLRLNVIWEFASDRARMLQISIVVVAIGYVLMWRYR